MWYNKYNGSQWDQDRQVPIDGMSASPSAVVYNNTLYVFHQHSHDDGKLYVFNVTNWGPDLPISKTMLSSSPAAAVFNGRLYCFHQGAGDNGQLCVQCLRRKHTHMGNRHAGSQHRDELISLCA